MLIQMLEICREMCKDKVLISYDKENITFKKTILANDEILENGVEDTVNLISSEVI